MIVREILHDPDIPFDYFNDYRDTDNWLRVIQKRQLPGAEKVDAIRERLRQGNEEHFRNRHGSPQTCQTQPGTKPITAGDSTPSPNTTPSSATTDNSTPTTPAG